MTYMVSENDGLVEVCVVREGDISSSFSIQVSTEEFNPPQAEGIEATHKIKLKNSLLLTLLF